MNMLDNLPPNAQKQVQQALLPGEEVRFVTRPRIELFSVQNLALTLGTGFAIVWWIGFAVMLGIYLSDWLEGKLSSASFFVIYGVLMLCYFIGRMISAVTLEEYQSLRRRFYLLTTYRAMILTPGDLLRSYPLRPGMIQRLKQWTDGTGHIYLQPEVKDKSPLSEHGCFACVPEPYRVAEFIRELADHVPSLSVEPAMYSKRVRLDSLLYQKLANRLEPDECVLWVGKPVSRMSILSKQERCKAYWDLAIAASACACCWASVFIGEGSAVGMTILALLHLLICLMLIFTQHVTCKEAYVITDRRVCCLNGYEEYDYERRVEGIWHYPCGAVMIIINFSTRPLQCIGPAKGINPVMLLWSACKK